MVPEFARFLSSALGPERPDDGKKAELATLRGELLERLHNHRADPGAVTLEEASARLEGAERHRRLKKLGSIAFYVLLPLALLLATTYHQMPDYFLGRDVPEWLPKALKRPVIVRRLSLVRQPLPHPLPKAQRDNYGFPEAPEPPTEASTPAELQNRILIQSMDSRDLPSDLIDAFGKADPDNGWLNLFLASRKADQINYGRSAHDPERASEVVELLSQALKKPAFADYMRFNRREQLEALRAPQTANERNTIVPLFYNEQVGLRCYRMIQVFLEEQTRLSIRGGQFDRVFELTRLSRDLTIRQLAQPGANNNFYSPLPAFTVDFTSYPSDPRWSDAKQLWTDFETLRKKGAAEITKGSSISWSNPAKEVSSNLKSGIYPARYSNSYIPAEQQLKAAISHRNDAFRVAWISSALLLFSSIFAAALRQQKRRFWLAGNLSGVFGWRTWLTTLAVGFLLPSIAWWLQMRHTRLGWRDLPHDAVDIHYLHDFPWFGQYLAAPLMVWLCSLQWAKREKARHFSFLGPRPRFLRTGWIPALLATALPSLYGMARLFPTRMEHWTLVVASIHGCLIVWLLWDIFGPKSITLDSLLVSRLTAPSIAAISIAASIGVFLANVEERRAVHLMNRYQTEAIARSDTDNIERARIWRKIFTDELR